MVASPRYDPTAHLRRLRARVFGIDLHLPPHAQGALAVARLAARSVGRYDSHIVRS
jgi:hypothetical protein